MTKGKVKVNNTILALPDSPPRVGLFYFTLMTFEEYKTLKKGDKVKVLSHVKDHYGEIWHERNSIATIDYFTNDGIGVIFEWSALGLHFSMIELT